MPDLTLIMAAIWLLESSRGKNFNHPDPHSHGHHGITDIVIRDLNQRAGCHKWRIEDCFDLNKSTAMGIEHIRNYHMERETVTNILLFWRCGHTGMLNAHPKQLEYARKGLDEYTQLLGELRNKQ